MTMKSSGAKETIANHSVDDVDGNTGNNSTEGAAIAPEKTAETRPERECNDLVIRDGFPALRLSGGKLPNIEGPEPLPRHAIWACDSALSFENLDAWIVDCEAVFTARTRESDENYSAGTTYFMPCQMKPRCALEALVLGIFRKHTDAIDPTMFDPQQSGAEWWTLILDKDDSEPKATKDKVKSTKTDNDKNDNDEEDEEEDDEVGWHFDADYGLEAQAPNLLLHPRLATVTYLTDSGAPTVVLNVKSPAPSDLDKKSLEGNVDKVWLSCPRVGKHMVFDGRLLHGAPATFFPATATTSVSAVEPNPKRPKLDPHAQSHKRVTLLVNIWLNHCPLDAEPLEDEVVEQLKCKWQNRASDASASAPGLGFAWKDENVNLDRLPDYTKLPFSNVCQEDPAGEEEVVLCGRIVTVEYGATMHELHHAAKVASSSADLLELSLSPGVLSLRVGEEYKADSDDEDDA